MSFRILLLGLAGLLVTACSPMSRRAPEDPEAAAAYGQRAALLTAVTRWKLGGRLALTDGREGGTGALTWFQDGPSTRMRFRGTLGQGSWELDADGEGAELSLADGRHYAAATVAQLVNSHVGWQVPVADLSWWVRGLAAAHAWESRQLDHEGRLVRLKQSGWEVEFGNYRPQDPAAVPAKLVARRDDYVVKLVVRDWQSGEAALRP